jgi:hypothetical protein
MFLDKSHDCGFHFERWRKHTSRVEDLALMAFLRAVLWRLEAALGFAYDDRQMEPLTTNVLLLFTYPT